jgi:RNA polymerase sigma factor (sigma-70 family)
MDAGHLARVAACRENLHHFEIGDLTPHDERMLLLQLAECRRKLAGAPAGCEETRVPLAAEALRTSTHLIPPPDSEENWDIPALGAIRRRYLELRSRLALGSIKLVALGAKQFRDRGIPYPDLMQEGFCGLLEAIDRFDVSNQNKLATYAMWWIRQRMQRAVAAGAYPVRLNPQCLRKLAEDQCRRERTTRDVYRETAVEPIPKAIGHLRAATRPAVSLDEARHDKSPLVQFIADPDEDATGEVDTRERLETLMRFLLPREKQVLSLRFGLRGQAQHSLSQAGEVLGLSKERIRQIQDRALEKLRTMV